MTVQKTQIELEKDKEQKIMETVAWRAAYYRANPQRYVSEVLGITLKLFQKILLWCMMHYNFTMYLAARGQTLYVLFSRMLLCILFSLQLYEHSTVFRFCS